MTQIFTLGSSSVYGVGSEVGGWGDILKQLIHHKMYGSNGIGEQFEVFNFAKSGATVEFVTRTFPEQLKNYSRGGKIITAIYVGGNNAKAEGTPDNFVSTIEDFSEEISKLLDFLKDKSNHVIAVGSGYYDESKTNPKPSPLAGRNSYFKNTRKRMFEAQFKKLAEDRSIPFVEVGVTEAEWKEKYIYDDGLHPNQSGYRLIAEKVFAIVEQWME